MEKETPILEYNQTNFKEKAIGVDGKLIVVDFWAPWCGPCQMMKPVIEEVMKGLTGITLEEVNVDEDQERAGEANVMSIPTFVIEDDNGVELDRKIGGLGKEDFKSWVISFIK